MRGTAARALLNHLRRSPPPLTPPTNCAAYRTSLLSLCRSLSSASAAHITIETTTRLNPKKDAKPKNNTFFQQKPDSHKEKSKAKLMTFGDLGVAQRLSEALKELCILFPNEIHCAGIPPIMKGKSLLLTSHSESVGSSSLGALTYLLPLIQRLRRDAKLSTEKPEGPRAVILCSTKEFANKLLCLAKFILNPFKLKPLVENGRIESNVQEEASDVSIGLLVSTPGEVLQKIEEGSVVPNEIKFMVFDDVDDMFNQGLGPEIQKFLSPLKEHASKGIQTILVTSVVTKSLREDLPFLVEHLESSQAEVAAITVEVDQTEAFHLLESPEALKQKAGEAVHSLQRVS